VSAALGSNVPPQPPPPPGPKPAAKAQPPDDTYISQIPEFADLYAKFVPISASLVNTKMLSQSISDADDFMSRADDAASNAKKKNSKIQHADFHFDQNSDPQQALDAHKVACNAAIGKIDAAHNKMSSLRIGMKKLKNGSNKFAMFVAETIEHLHDEINFRASAVDDSFKELPALEAFALKQVNKKISGHNKAMSGAERNIGLDVDGLRRHLDQVVEKKGNLESKLRDLNKKKQPSPDVLLNILASEANIVEGIGKLYGIAQGEHSKILAITRSPIVNTQKIDDIPTIHNRILTESGVASIAYDASSDALASANPLITRLDKFEDEIDQYIPIFSELYKVLNKWEERSGIKGGDNVEIVVDDASVYLDVDSQVSTAIRSRNIQDLKRILDAVATIDNAADPKKVGSSENLRKYQIAKFAGMLEGKPSAGDFLFVFGDILREYEKLVAGPPDGDKWAISALLPKALPWAQANMAPQEFGRFMVGWAKFKKIEGDQATK
jgi:hypothetical protein